MPTPARPYRTPPPVPPGYARCDCCGSPFTVAARGRPRRFCSDECRRMEYQLGKLEEWIENFPAEAPAEGRAALRRRLWRVANLLNATGGSKLSSY